MEKIKKIAEFREVFGNKDEDSLLEGVGFLDIETTGLKPDYHKLTMVGLHSLPSTKIYVDKEESMKANEEIKKYDYLVTYNGNRFDIPFLDHHIGLDKNFVSIDLMHMLHELGIYGGLKGAERHLGLTRAEDVCNMRGSDAVVLWKRYKRGCEDSLKKLINYNLEDIVNLEVLFLYLFYTAKKYPVNEANIIYWKKAVMERIKSNNCFTLLK
jgi:uncharacterized protein